MSARNCLRVVVGAFLSERIYLRAIVGALLSCALMSGHRFWGWPIQWNHAQCCGPTPVAMATKFGLGAEIQSPTGLLLKLPTVRDYKWRSLSLQLNLPSVSFLPLMNRHLDHFTDITICLMHVTACKLENSSGWVMAVKMTVTV